MAPTDPLALPEIRETLASFIPSNDLARCVRVCRAWHTSFVPFLWHSVDVLYSTPAVQALQKHCGYVRRLSHFGYFPQAYHAIHYPGLRMLQFRSIDYGHRGFPLIQRHPSLTHIRMVGDSYAKFASTFLFTNPSSLTSLSLTGVDLRSPDWHTFWESLMPLQTIELRNCGLWDASPPPPKGCWKATDLALLLKLGLSAMDQLLWVAQCSQLKRLTWRVPGDFGYFPIEKFIQTLGSWPALEDVQLLESRASDRQLSLVIQGIQHLKALSVTRTELGDLSEAALRPHFPHLTKLDISNNAISLGRFIVDILQQCPQLESLRTDKIAIDYFMDGEPWACERSLKVLEVCFEISPWKTEAGQEALLERLSRLSNLERLDLCDRETLDNVLTLDFRLEKGLERLGALRRLEELKINRTIQELTNQDVEWIIKHWRNLKRLEGVLNTMSMAETRSLAAKLRRAGVEVISC